MEKEFFFMIKKYAKVLSEMESSWTSILIRTGDVILEIADDADFSELQETDLHLVPKYRYPVEQRILKHRASGSALVLSKTPCCMIVGARPEGLLPPLDDMAQIIGPQAESVSPETDAAAVALEKADGCFVRGRYTITAGRSLFEAVTALQVLEKSAEVSLKAEVLGGAVPIEPGEARWMRENYLKHYSRAEAEAKRQEGM